MADSWKRLLFQILLLLVCCRHIDTKTPGATPPPLVPITSLATDERSVSLKGESHTEKVELLNPVNLALQCTWTGNQNKAPNITGFWRKDGDEVENSRVTVQLEGDQYELKRVFSIVNEESLGSYSCVFGSEAKIEFVLAAPQVGEVRDKPIVSYVGDSVVITCKMEEPKPKPSTWNWYKANGTDKEQISAVAEPLRYEIENEESKTKLVVHNLTEADGGLYYCGAVYAISTTMGRVELKVISFQEPLKPFIAIVIEVVVLVAAILLYERSQSKKDYTPENGTTDQMNTMAHRDNTGPEETSTRQRKI
ncbi:embigin isoform X1 [Pseudoliparis swirei]|uniref:embigin isoform X1 n=1 Tax=Pseudoliparis swirei TaxID=2059687 RepID=UPI0024BDECB8|nr:embigin isoform X1 [Pseudoliparis swirei]